MKVKFNTAKGSKLIKKSLLALKNALTDQGLEICFKFLITLLVAR